MTFLDSEDPLVVILPGCHRCAGLGFDAEKIKYAAIVNLQRSGWIAEDQPGVNYLRREFELFSSRMERAIENPWITVSKRKRSRFSGSPHDAASRSEESQPNLPTNGFLNLTLHESAADDQHDGQATSNDEAARPSSSEGAVPPRKKTKKHPKKVYLFKQEMEKLIVEIPLSVNQAERKLHKQTNSADSTPLLYLALRAGLSGFGIVDARRQRRPRMDRNPA